MIKYPLMVTLAQGVTQDTLYITACLLSVNNIGDLLRMALRSTKWVIYSMPSLNLSSIFFQKSHSKLPFNTLKKKGAGNRGPKSLV